MTFEDTPAYDTPCRSTSMMHGIKTMLYTEYNSLLLLLAESQLATSAVRLMTFFYKTEDHKLQTEANFSTTSSPTNELHPWDALPSLLSNFSTPPNTCLH